MPSRTREREKLSVYIYVPIKRKLCITDAYFIKVGHVRGECEFLYIYIYIAAASEYIDLFIIHMSICMCVLK